MANKTAISGEMGALLPCPNPWCVPSERLLPTLIWQLDAACVECASCGMQGPSINVRVFDEDGEQIGTRDAEAEAIAAWNTRPTPTDAGVEGLAEVTKADRDLWKWLLDAPFATCSRIDNLPDDTPELQKIAKHRLRRADEGECICPKCGIRHGISDSDGGF